MNISEKKQDMAVGNRIYFLDNLRTFMIFLVVLCHAGGVYESSGTWASFWIIDDPSTNNLVGLLFLIFDIFMMPTIFFISGFFAPLSLQNKTGLAFAKSKFKRLIVPWIIASLTLIPLYKVIFLYSRNLPQESWTTYFHFSNGIWSQNWLWFLPVLFLFDIVYLLISKIKIRLLNMSLKAAIAGAFLIGFAYSLSMDIFSVRGWTKSVLLDFQNERLLIYFLAFLLGALSFRLKAFEAKPKSKRLYIIVNCIAWLPVTVYINFLLYPWFNPGSYIISQFAHRLILWFSFCLSVLCMMYVTVETFRLYLDRQGRLSRELNRNSYYVYIIHVIVIGVIALGMLNTAIPSLLKFLLLTVLTLAVSNVLISACRYLFTVLKETRKLEEPAMRTIATAVLLVILVTAAGCGKQENPEKETRPPRISLHTAALTGNIDAIRRHIDAGSDLDQKDAYGSTPLIVAATFGRTEIAEVLLDAGADMTITNNDGSTPLHIAAFLCRTEIVQILLDKGADKNALNKAGRTPLDSVSRPFDEVKPTYDGLTTSLAPLGLKLDYEHIKTARPKIAEMLRYQEG